MDTTFTIGKLADSAGVNVETIRYYQRRGLFVEPQKPACGYRRYTADTIKRIRFIKRAQALGFTLEDISALLGLDAAGACAETRHAAAQKLAVIDEKLSALNTMRAELAALLAKCEGVGSGSCPIIEVLVTD